MPLIKDRDRTEIGKLFEQIEQDVKLVMFTQEQECQFCELTRQLVEEVAAISPKVHVEIHDFVADADLAKQYGIDKIPAIAVVGEQDYRIRFYGIPSGYEFPALLEAIVDVGQRGPALSDSMLAGLSRGDEPVHIQVMVTPTCPYCSRAVRTAHKFAMANENIRGDMVEVSEYPHLVHKYGVQGVPKTVINETHDFVGAQPDENVLEAILKALGK